jgi:hypothetical protein
VDDHLRNALSAEYGVLAASFDKHSTVGYSIIPVALTAIGGLAILSESSSPYSGIAVSFMLLVLVAWIGSSHSILNAVGLRLVAIELQFERPTQPGRTSQPFFFTTFVATGSPGLYIYWALFLIVGCAALWLGMYKWDAALVQWGWSNSQRTLGVGIPVALNVFSLGVVYCVQRLVEDEKKRLISVATKPQQAVEKAQ